MCKLVCFGDEMNKKVMTRLIRKVEGIFCQGFDQMKKFNNLGPLHGNIWNQMVHHEYKVTCFNCYHHHHTGEKSLHLAMKGLLVIHPTGKSEENAAMCKWDWFFFHHISNLSYTQCYGFLFMAHYDFVNNDPSCMHWKVFFRYSGWRFTCFMEMLWRVLLQSNKE